MRERIFEFKKEINPSVIIKVITYPNAQIKEIINPKNIRFPYVIGQILNMGHMTWACANGFLVNGKKPCGSEKIFGIRVEDIPPGHELRMLYPHKFR